MTAVQESRLRELRSRVLVRAFDHRPAVVPLEEQAAVAAERVCQRAIGQQQAERGAELARILIVQPGVAPETLPNQDVASGRREHRPAKRPRFERHH